MEGWCGRQPIYFVLLLINERIEQWKGGELMAKKPPAPPPEQGFARCPPLLLATKVELGTSERLVVHLLQLLHS